MKAYNDTDFPGSLKEALSRLEFICNTIPALLSAIPEKEFSLKPAPGKWSKKETLGHLIDSAANNHQRFVRGQFENAPTIIYDQDNWNTFSRYQQIEGRHLILFWETFNRHLGEIVKNIPAEGLQRKCNTESDHTIEWLFIDYVKHLEYHLRQIVAY